MFRFGALVLCVSLALSLGDDCQSEECASEVLNAVELLQVKHEFPAAELQEEADDAIAPLPDTAVLNRTSGPQKEELTLAGAEKLMLTMLGVNSTNELNASQQTRLENCKAKVQGKAGTWGPPVWKDAYCPSSQRLDISGLTNAWFTVEGCSIMTCFFYTNACGPYFYTNADRTDDSSFAACKCCTWYNPTRYGSSKGNNIYKGC
mmetsp:Transcript_9759/g.22430  ORF Transcript_9759/g.22430 Transcript_9759/m.22430 type:complete len:205 (-) Transcript_9759:111-725(-)